MRKKYIRRVTYIVFTACVIYPVALALWGLA